MFSIKTNSEDRKPVIAAAAVGLLEEMNRASGRGISLAYAAHYLRQYGAVHVFCPFSTGSKWELKWCYQIAQAALGRLVRSRQAQTFLGVGERRDEVKMYEPKSLELK